MAKTVKERVADHRSKVYNNPEASAKLRLKDRIRKQNKRKKIKEEGGLTAINMRKKASEYQKKWREGQRKLLKQVALAATQNNESLDIDSLGCTPQSIGKAVRKVERVMPKSPRKKAAVMGKLMSKVSPKKSRLIVKLSLMPRKVDAKRKKRSDALTAEEVQEIRDFYRRDDISRMCPGRKDFVSVKTDKGREHRQKRVLICNLKEIHQMFCAEKSLKVSFSKFCSLRPEEVMLTGDKGQEVCQCEYLENIEMCVEGLTKVVVLLPKNVREVVEMTVCSMDKENCVDRKCTDCSVTKLDSCFEGYDDEMEISYRKWTKDNIVRKELIQTDIAEAKQDLYKQLETFARHMYNAKRQHTELKHLKESLAANQVILQEGFAENYTLRQQNEIMAAHWASQQVTLFTAVVYYKENDELQSISYCIISDELDHSKYSVFVFNKLIINDIVRRLGSSRVQHIYYWSDGCGSQFKNKYTVKSTIS